MLQRTCRLVSSLFQRWRWRGPQFKIHLLQFHLLLPQPLLTLLAHPPNHSSHQSISLSVLGSYLLLWMLFSLLLLLRHRWTSRWPEPRSLDVTEPTQPTVCDPSDVSASAASLDILVVAATDSDQSVSKPPRE